MRNDIWILAAPVLISACVQMTPERQLLNEASQALGGIGPIQNVKTLIIEGEGTAADAKTDLPAWKVTEFKRTIDIGSGRMRVSQVRTAPLPSTPAAVQRQTIGLDGDKAYDVGSDGVASRAPEPAVRERRMELLHHPITAVRAALDPSSKRANLREQGNLQLLDITTEKGEMLTLAFDRTTKLPVMVTSGSVAMETSFSDYEETGGLKLPKRLTTKLDNHVRFDLRVTKNTIDGDIGNLSAPRN